MSDLTETELAYLEKFDMAGTAIGEPAWERRRHKYERAVFDAMPRLVAAVRERDAYRKALEFYANEKHYNENGAPGKAAFSSIPGEPTEYDFDPDMGEVARGAVKRPNKTPAAGEEGE